jgi:Ca2+-binding RTX toxin-like protein
MVIRRGSNATDRLVGTSANDRLQGLGGNDLLLGGGGNDVLDGGKGADTASWADAAGRGSDGFLYGIGVDLARGIADGLRMGYLHEPGLTHDRLVSIEHAIGSPFMDHLAGSAAANRLWGGAGADWLEGRDGADTLRGGSGADSLYGDAGADVLYGEAGSDFLYGGEGHDRLRGEAGEDWLDGDAGNDVLEGGDGDDRLFSGDGGNDRLDGGAGRDIADYTGSAAGIRADLAAGTVASKAGTDKLLAVEGVEGSAYADLIRGDGHANTLTGGEGDDRIWGGGGNDRIEDGSHYRPGHHNLLDGGAGADWIAGSDGSDLIYGGLGRDQLTGGTRGSLTGAADQDRIDLGADRDADTVRFELYDGSPFAGSFGVDRLAHFDPAKDELAFFVGQERYGGKGYIVDVGDFLDSTNNGRIDAADRDVSRDGKDLVLDIKAVWEHAMGRSLPGGQPQTVILEGVSGFAADHVDSGLDQHRGYTVLTQDFVL